MDNIIWLILYGTYWPLQPDDPVNITLSKLTNTRQLRDKSLNMDRVTWSFPRI